MVVFVKTAINMSELTRYDDEMPYVITLAVSGITFLILSIVGGITCGGMGEAIKAAGIFFIVVLEFYLIAGWFFYIIKIFKVSKEAKNILGNISLSGRTLGEAISDKEHRIKELQAEYDQMYKLLN